MTSSYCVAFNRDRDFYQVPVALATAGKLESLVTDIYLPDRFKDSRIFRYLGLDHRHSDSLPSSFVRFSPKALWLQIVSLKLSRNDRRRSEIFKHLDSILSRKVGHLSLQSGSGLFLYSGYALEAFEMVLDSKLPRLLFVFHPQGDFVRQILEEDFARHPEIGFSHRRHLNEIALIEGQRVADEISLATGIACASTFTAASVQSCAPSLKSEIGIIPYGCFPSIPVVNNVFNKSSRPQLLFVGQGTQRKGLHHLLKVWRDGFYLDADLTLVVNQLDPGIAQMISALPVAPTVLERLSRAELLLQYQRADIFVLPSLVEGFGLVYLEALSAGCHVIGSSNTGLPDLAPPLEAATVIPAGDPESLFTSLQSAITIAANGGFNRGYIQAFAATRSWQAFRSGILGFLESVEGIPF